MSDSDDDEQEPNWELLSETLGTTALKALREHWDSKQVADSAAEAPAQRVANENESIFQPGPVAVTSNLDFKTHSYWEERFAIEDSYEWLAAFDTLRPALTRLLPPAHNCPKLLLVGCGNSNFSADLFDAGWTDITSTDFSKVVIERMRSKEAALRPSMKWEVEDMLSLESIADSTYDAVVDKAAMDALMCDEGSVWDPAPRTRRDAAAMCRAVSRVLKPGGCFLQISFAQPHFRKRYLQDSFPTDHDEESSNSNSTTGANTASVNNAGSGAASLSSSSSSSSAEVAEGAPSNSAYGWTVSHEAVGEAGCLESYVYLCVKDGQGAATSSEISEHSPDLPPAPPPLLRQIS